MGVFTRMSTERMGDMKVLVGLFQAFGMLIVLLSAWTIIIVGALWVGEIMAKVFPEEWVVGTWNRLVRYGRTLRRHGRNR